MTSNLLAKRSLKSRMETAHLFASICATCTPGTPRKTSGKVVAPERRISYWEIICAAAAVFNNGSDFLSDRHNLHIH